MGVNKYNAEGYFDPTAYEALTNIEKEMKKSAFKTLIYICSPYSGNVDVNVKKAQHFCLFAIDKNYIPLAPHLFFPQFMDDENPNERKLAIFMDIVLMSKCTEVWVFGDTLSSGMAMEIEKAKRKGQPIRHFTNELLEVERL
jgi:hypothetical protein